MWDTNLPCQLSAQEWAKSTISTSWTRMKAKPPRSPKYIQVGPNDPWGMKKAPTQPPTTIMYLTPQKPFCQPARGSLDVLT